MQAKAWEMLAVETPWGGVSGGGEPGWPGEVMGLGGGIGGTLRAMKRGSECGAG